MALCCGFCHEEVQDKDEVVMDDIACIRHKKCYDLDNNSYPVDSIGLYEDVREHFPKFLLNAYKEVFAMDPEETRAAHEISDEEVIASIGYTLGYLS